MKTAQILIVAMILASALLTAQDPALQFEVASVHLSDPAPPTNNGPFMRLTGGPGTADPEHLRYSRVSMLRLIATSFLIQADQIAGPDWVRTEDGPERFDIIANLPAGATREQMAAMMLNLLKERFHFAWHVEKKDFDVYELVVGKGGSKLKDAEIPETIPESPSGRLDINRGNDGFPVLPAGSPLGEGASASGNGSMFISLQAMKGFQLAPPPGSRIIPMGLTRFTFRMVTIKQLIGAVQRYTESSHIVDHTGLNGTYDVKVAFSAGSPPARPGVGGGVSGDEASEPAPDVFAAFDRQLGLKFQKTKAPLDVIVIDHIDKSPTEN